MRFIHLPDSFYELKYGLDLEPGPSNEGWAKLDEPPESGILGDEGGLGDSLGSTGKFISGGTLWYDEEVSESPRNLASQSRRGAHPDAPTPFTRLAKKIAQKVSGRSNYYPGDWRKPKTDRRAES